MQPIKKFFFGQTEPTRKDRHRSSNSSFFYQYLNWILYCTLFCTYCLKFRYSEKATKFSQSSTFYLTLNCSVELYIRKCGRWDKFLWPSQNTWTLHTCIHKVQKTGQGRAVQTLYHNPITFGFHHIRGKHGVKVGASGC